MINLFLVLAGTLMIEAADTDASRVIGGAVFAVGLASAVADVKATL